MPRITYQDFDVLFASTGKAGEYSAKVFGKSGNASVAFTLADILTNNVAPAVPAAPTNAAIEEDRANRNIIFAKTIVEPENYYFTRRRAPALDEAKRLGGNLFAKVFKESLRTAFEVRREMLRDRKTFLRVRLHLTDVPELATLPWEFLYNAETNHFYAQLPGTPVVRYLDIQEPIDELTVEGALRMLVVTSSPTGEQPLNVNGEYEKLEAALAPLRDKNLITLERLKRPPGKTMLDALQDELQDNFENSPFHIFHFIGHGVFDNATGAGYLLFEDDTGAATLVSGETLSVILNGQELRLAVINSCEGAISARQNAYAGVAQALCRNALIPAVLAMQFDITDNAAIRFAEKFYGALTKDFPVEAALAESRKAILSMPNEVEWATPVLYMRADDGRMRVGKNSDVIITSENLEPIIENPSNGNLSAAPTNALAEHYNAVIETVRDSQFVPFVGMDANLFGRFSKPDAWTSADGLPGSAELASHLSRTFEYPLNDLPDLARIAQYSIAARRLDNLYDEIKKIFISNAPVAPTALHLTIARLAAKVAAETEKEKSTLEKSTFLRPTNFSRRRFIAVSVSYDNLFEAAFKSEVKDFHVVSYTARGKQRGKFLHQRFAGGQLAAAPDYIGSPNDYNGLADGNPIILKLPGMVEDVAPNFAITEDDYFNYLINSELTSLLPAVITDKLKASNHLFLGYSPRSWNMRALLYRIWEDQTTFRESWAVLDDTHAIDETFWLACNVTIIRSGLKEYVEGLNGAIESNKNL